MNGVVPSAGLAGRAEQVVGQVVGVEVDVRMVTEVYSVRAGAASVPPVVLAVQRAGGGEVDVLLCRPFDVFDSGRHDRRGRVGHALVGDPGPFRTLRRFTHGRMGEADSDL